MKIGTKWCVGVGFLALVFIGGYGRLLHAQSTFGAIVGNIRDQQGMAMPGVEVIVINQNTNFTRTAITDDQGGYEFLNVVAGTYRVQATQPGFKTFAKKGIELNSRQTLRMDVVMEVGELTQTVTVQARPGAIDTETSTLSGTIPGGEVHFLSPTTDSQRPWTLLRLNPLVQNTNSGTRFSMGGAYFNQTEFQIDGISAPFGAGGPAGSVVMSSESVQEVKILAVNNSAEYASPGIFQQISMGGTNALRGDFYYYYNTPGLNARQATASVRDSTLNHQFGGNIGGPIHIPWLYDGHDKTFFNLSWQSKRTRGSTWYVANVPTLAMRKGIFGTTKIKDPVTGQLFADNTIPGSRISPVSKYFQDNFFELPNQPDPNSTSNNFQIQGPTGTTREEVLDLRIDQQIHNKHLFYVRVGGTQFDNRAFDSSMPKMGFRTGTRKLYSGAISHNYTIRPSLLNEFRVGFTRDNSPGGGSNNGLEVLRAAGIQFPSDIPVPDARGFPMMTITGLTPLQQQATSSTISPSYQLTDTASWIRGRHTIKSGINIFWEQPNSTRIPAGAHGSFQFQGTYAGSAYADFLLGIPYQTNVQGISPNTYMRSTNYGLFFQDDFKFRSNLTLNLGVRLDYQGPIYNKNNALQNFDPATGSMIKAAPDTPVNTAFGVPVLEATAVGLPVRTLHFSGAHIAPRIGFAWRPRNSETFVVRGGWGKFTDMLGQGLFAKLAADGILNRGSRQLPNPAADSKTGIIPKTTFMFPYPFPAAIAGERAPGLVAKGFDPHLANPYIQQWNLTLEKVVSEISFRASYVGTKSTNLVYARDINQRRTAALDSSRPYNSKGYTTTVEYMQNGGNQIYHGLQLEAGRRFSKGFALQLGYVWSNNISDVIDQDDNDAKGIATDANNRSLDRGRVGYNRKHNLTGYAIWELPFGRERRLLNGLPAWVNQIVSGWELQPELFAGSGQWFTPCRVSNNPFTNGDCTSQTARPDRVGDGNNGPRLTGGPNIKWFDTSAFVNPAATALGTAGRTILLGPGFWHASISLTKKCRFSESKQLWLTAAAMNVFNHPNFRSPTASGEITVGQPAFGSTATLLGTDRAADRARSRAVWLRARIIF